MLAEVAPPVWRRVRVSGDLSLERLHDVMQGAMGWDDAHLHEWIVDGQRYGEPEPDEPGYEVEDERKLTLRGPAGVDRRPLRPRGARSGCGESQVEAAQVSGVGTSPPAARKTGAPRKSCWT
jgi:hypothetical protein